MRLSLFIIIILISLPATVTVDSQSQDIEVLEMELLVDTSIHNQTTLHISQIIRITSSVNISSFTLQFNLLLSDVRTSINGSLVPNSVRSQNSETTIDITSPDLLQTDTIIELVMESDLEPELNQVDSNHYQMFLNWLSDPAPLWANVTIILPRAMILAKSQDSLNIFPQPTSLETDGERISVNWYNLRGSTQNTRIFVEFMDEDNSHLVSISTLIQTSTNNQWNDGIIAILIVFLIIALVSVGYWYSKYDKLSKVPAKKNETKIVRVMKPVILTTGEKEILQLIADHGGNIYQSELVDIVNVGKSRVSQYLSDFEDKGLIKKVKKGRENVVHLNFEAEELQDA